MALIVALLPALVSFIDGLTKDARAVFKILGPMLKVLAIFLLVIFFLQATDFFLRAGRAYHDDFEYSRELKKAPLGCDYPVGAVQYLKSNLVPERMLNDYNWGGYLVWKLPDRKVFVDGRMDNFFVNGRSFASQYWRIVNLDSSWQKLLTEYEIEAVLLSPAWPVVEALRLIPEWEIGYEDPASVLFIKKAEL